MHVCLNCGNQYTCSCNRRFASDEAVVCSRCLEAYELKLKDGDGAITTEVVTTTTTQA
jgi:hydrogenase maturation factor HypF (carbamoyltransferase family)